MNFDEFYVGFRELGRYQTGVLWLLCLPACFMNAYNGYGLVFLTYTPTHTCTKSPSFPNNTQRGWSNATHYNVTAHKCAISYIRLQKDGIEITETEPCEAWEFSQEYFSETLVTRWGLVCSREIEAKTMISVVGGMAVIGCLLYAHIADRWGRKVAFQLNVVTYVFGASVSLYMPNLVSFTLVRLLAAINAISSWNTAYIWALEYIGPNKRTMATAVMGFVYALAMASLSLVGIAADTWRQFGLAVSLPFLLLLSYQWLVSESPQWSLSAGHEDSAERAVYRMIYWEGRQVRMDSEQHNLRFQEVILAKRREKSDNVKTSIIDLFRGRELLLKTVLVCWCFIANAVVYTSIAYNTENFGGNFYVNWAVGSLVEGPATLLNILYLNRLGRVRPLAVAMAIAGICCVLTALGPLVGDWWVVSLAFVGKFAICSSYAIVYQLAGELFPTVVRSTGIGLASLIGDLGNITMPFIIYSSNTYKVLPMLIIGVVSVVGGLGALLLPETMGQPLPQSLKDAEVTSCGMATLRHNLGLCRREKEPEPVEL